MNALKSEISRENHKKSGQLDILQTCELEVILSSTQSYNTIPNSAYGIQRGLVTGSSS